MEYAGFWRRASATTLDGLFFGLIVISILFPIGASQALLSEHPSLAGAILNLALSFGFVAIVSAFESSSYQATPGKMLLGLRVVDIEEHRISFLHAFGRNIARVVPILLGVVVFILCSGIGAILPIKIALILKIIGVIAVLAGALFSSIPWITVPFASKKQGIHDMIAGCVVLQSQKSSAYQKFETIWNNVVFYGLGALIVGGLVVCCFVPAIKMRAHHRVADVAQSMSDSEAYMPAKIPPPVDSLGEVEGLLRTKGR